MAFDCRLSPRKFVHRVVFLFIAACLVASAQAQGIHTTLRSHTNPYGAYQSYAGVWGDGNYAYIASERRNGVLIYDISNPDAPVLASYYAPSNSLDMEDVKVSNGVGFFADNMGSGLHIVNVSDPTNPQLLSQITSANGGYDNTHKVAVWQNFVFIPQNLTAPALIKVFDVSNPAIPVLKTTITSTDPMWVNDMDIQDNGSGSVRLYTAGWGGKCDIWDITNIATQAPVLLGSFSAGIDGSSASATADGNYLAYSRKTTDGTSEVKIYNISNPANVTVASTLTMSALGIDAIAPHDPKIMGNLLYVSWFQAGTLIFDITNPYSPVLVGSYDTWPGAVNATQLDGNWGVYPYLGQDRVLLSDRNTGLYIIDATGVNSQAALYNFKLNPSTLVGGLNSIGTVFLVGVAPSGGAVANLSSNNSLAVIPASVTIPASGTSAPVTVTTSGVSSKTTASLTASYGGSTLTAVLTLTPEIPSSLKFSPTSLVGGLTTTGTLTLGAPTLSDTSVPLSVVSGSAAVASIPSAVTVPAGASTATFGVVTNAVSTSTVAKISASLNGTTVTNTFTATPNTPSSLKFSPTSVIAGATSTGTVTLGAPAVGNVSVTLTVTSGGAAVGSIPASVIVPAGSSTATFPLVTANVSAKTTIQVSAAANGGTKSASLTVTANTPSSLKFSPTSVIGGASSTGTVTLAATAAADIPVTLTVTSGASAVSSIPASVTVPAGSISATFVLVTANVSAKTTVQVSAAANGVTRTGSLTVTVNTLSSLKFSPASVIAGVASTGTVTLAATAAADIPVSLTITGGVAAVNSIPVSVTVPAGSSSATFSLVTANISVNTNVQVSAVASGVTRSATLTVTPNTPTSASFNPNSVTGGATATGTVAFAQPLASDVTATFTLLSGGSALVSPPAMIAIPAGSTSASWTVVTKTVSSAITVQMKVVVNGGSKTATLTVN
jgi:hypothetical protein